MTEGIDNNTQEFTAAGAKAAVVTGASTGIGEATVRALRKEGWTVFAVARRADRLEALAAETGAVALPADVTDEQATALFKSIDTEGTGSINRDQFSEFANANGEGQAPEQSLAAPVNIQKGIDDLLTMLESLSPGGQMETEAA